MKRRQPHHLIVLFKLKKTSFITFLVCLIFLSVLSLGYYDLSTNSQANSNGITIVLDAGHGARDGGSIGTLGTVEKEINLRYTLKLKEKLLNAGYRVELTRKTDDPLYLQDSPNKKLSDMKTRMNIIRRANPNLVVSIHMNSFPDKTVSGANTYYRKDDVSGKIVADLIQSSLNKYCHAKNKLGKIGDYYILNQSYYTAVLVECGFLSNIEEERLLNTDEYCDKFSSAVCSAIMLYLGNGLSA